MPYEPVIGLEVHVQLKTASKLFCGCSTRFGAPPNTQICPVCLGYPGVLPVLNSEALTYIVSTGLALGSEISTLSKFDRKNYFYPDLPKAYQISQYDQPLCLGGQVQISADGAKKTIRLIRIHLEEDAGKLVHFKSDSGVDYNRVGVPLMEIVSAPDLRSPQDAYEYLKALKTILEYLEVSDCNMEEGSLRCDANVSLRPAGSEVFGNKVEIKNLNSIRGVEKALLYEIERQTACLGRGERIVQETRLWNADEGLTRSMRSKEEAHDYRYFPEPDLVPVMMGRSEIERLREGLPELPFVRKERLAREYGIPEYDAGVLTASRATADYFEKCAKISSDAKAVGNWIMGDLMRELKTHGKDIRDSTVLPEHLAALVDLIREGTVSGKMAKDIFLEMYEKGHSPRDIVSAKGMSQISDVSRIEAVIRKVIEENAKSVEDYHKGKKNVLAFLVGQVMKATRGRANPKLVNELLLSVIAREVA